MIPTLDVRHIPSAASFYLEVLQPLNLRYLSTDKDPKSEKTTSVVYGGSQSPAAIFQLQKTPNPKISHVTLSAPSSEAVIDFHRRALRSNPRLIGTSSSLQFIRSPSQSSSAPIAGKRQETRARATDLDGNRMDVVYMPPPGYPQGYAGSTVRKTECTASEVSRILDWNYNVATSDKDTIVSFRSSSNMSDHNLAYGDASAIARGANGIKPLKRSSTEPVHHGSSLATATKEQNASGWNSTAVLGTMLGTAAGVMAGAALTYSVMKGDENKASQQAFEAQPYVRRSTFPENQLQRQIQAPKSQAAIESQMARLALEAPPARSRVVDDMGDIRSRASRYPPSAISGRTAVNRTRSNSEAGGPRKPLLLTETEHRSVYAPSAVGSRASTARAPAGSVVGGKTASIAPSRVSQHTSATRRGGSTYEDPGRPLMANIPLDGTEPAIRSMGGAASVAPSRHSKAPSEYIYEDPGRPLMANIPLDGAHKAPVSAAGAPSIAPSRHTSRDAPSVAPSRHTSRDAPAGGDGLPWWDAPRPELMANLPLDDLPPNYNPAGSVAAASRSSFSRSRPVDDFEVVAEDTAYVLDTGRDNRSHVSTRSRQTATASRPPITGGGTGASVAGSRYDPNSARKRSSSRSRAPTQVSARQVPLPRSTAGWDGDDDVASLAPSDSISNIGSRYR